MSLDDPTVESKHEGVLLLQQVTDVDEKVAVNAAIDLILLPTKRGQTKVLLNGYIYHLKGKRRSYADSLCTAAFILIYISKIM